MEAYINVYKDVLTNKYTEFEGRAGRYEFWSFVLINFLASVAISIIGSILHTGVLGDLYSLAVFIPSLALGARRLHDLNKSGWWQLLWAIPVIGWIILLVWATTKGDIGTNAFGAEPKTIEVIKPTTPATPI